jgi:hypothetical protein
MSPSDRTWPGQQPSSGRSTGADERAWPTSAASTDHENLAVRDREVLEFAAAHPFIRHDHVKALLGDTLQLAAQRLDALAQAGLLSCQPAFHRQADSYQITRRGIAAIDSQLPVPRYETVRSYRHHDGVIWVALAAHHGVYGDLERILTGRQMRALDTNTIPSDHVFATPSDHRLPPFGVQLNPDQPDNPRHYPDLMLILPQGRVAIELQLLPPDPDRLARHVAAYGADPKIAVALYLVTDQAVGTTIQAAAAELGLSAPTHVQRAQYGRHRPADLAH